ncbi:hypothetical protein [Streptomyces spiralis]|uniref:hypothetical protein n=1 Tax=Streptomyces spiralis TaxID=66376 RepID=UPI0036D10FFC
MDTVPTELGAGDHPELFRSAHPFLQRALRRMPGLRVPCTGRLFEALVPAIIEQRVVGLDAHAAFARLVRAHGAEPPGPAPQGMRVPPTPKAWASQAVTFARRLEKVRRAEGCAVRPNAMFAVAAQ